MIEKTIYKPGIHNITNEEYHGSAGISRSGIAEFKKCPKKFWNKYLNPNYIPDPSSKALILGNAFHTLVLEPKEFTNRYFVQEEDAIITGKPLLLKDVGREAFEEDKKRIANLQALKAERDKKNELLSKGKTILKWNDYHTIEKMGFSIYKDEECSGLIEGAQYEQSIYWIDEETQILCKVRPDIMHENFIVDLKTTSDASYKAFQRDLFNYNYHIQMAMIQEAIRCTQDKLITDFIVLAVEKEEPFCHTIYIMDDLIIEKGMQEFKNHLRNIKECFDNDQWPSYPSQIITLPSYAKFEEL